MAPLCYFFCIYFGNLFPYDVYCVIIVILQLATLLQQVFNINIKNKQFRFGPLTCYFLNRPKFDIINQGIEQTKSIICLWIGGRGKFPYYFYYFRVIFIKGP